MQVHDGKILEDLGEAKSLVAFVNGFGWLHGSSQPTIVHYRSLAGVTDADFDEMKLRVEELLQQRKLPLGQMTGRFQAIPNC